MSVEYVCVACGGTRIVINDLRGVTPSDDIDCPRCHNRAIRVRPIEDVVRLATEIIEDVADIFRERYSDDEDWVRYLGAAVDKWLAEVK